MVPKANFAEEDTLVEEQAVVAELVADQQASKKNQCFETKNTFTGGCATIGGGLCNCGGGPANICLGGPLCIGLGGGGPVRTTWPFLLFEPLLIAQKIMTSTETRMPAEILRKIHAFT